MAQSTDAGASTSSSGLEQLLTLLLLISPLFFWGMSMKVGVPLHGNTFRIPVTCVGGLLDCTRQRP